MADLAPLFTQVNEWMNIFVPVVVIGVILSWTFWLVSIAGRAVATHEDDITAATDTLKALLDERKRKAHDHLYLEHEPEELGTVWAETEDGEIVQLQRKD